jgi:hypothetical protein
MVIECNILNLSSNKEGLEAIINKKAPLMRIRRLLCLFRKFLLLRWMRGGRRDCVTLVMLSGVEGHVCDAPKLFLIEEVEEDSITVEEIVEREEEDPGKIFMDQEPEISLNAITGSPNPKTENNRNDQGSTCYNSY